MQFVRWDQTEDMPTNRYGIPEPTGPATPLETLKVIVLPCSAIDDSGTRVGMGAGFYDRAMAPLAGTPVLATPSVETTSVDTDSAAPGTRAKPAEPAEPAPQEVATGTAASERHRALLIGVAFECQRVAADTRIVANDWDVGVDLVVTESATVDPSGHVARR